ncbi:MAG: truB [Rickettsiaceae bacterium]|jgi:tRNA pseudouridine55 synthase|nr:truB [Rickettsiaceae bacterium]
MQKKSREPINGWLIINKPIGVNSTRVVSIVKRVFNAQKVGHAGTLDPLADGVLPIALGEATKTINYAMDSDKEYVFTVKWGQETSTCDSEGEVIATSEKIPTQDEITSILDNFVGKIDQIPPVYSAIKIDGKRAYDLARSGQVVEMKAREVVIHELELALDGVCNPVYTFMSKQPNNDMNMRKGLQTTSGTNSYTTFRVRCGKGTYVRSLARDIAEKLGTKAHVTRLIRTKVGKFTINNAILLENFEDKVYKADSLGLLLPVETVLDDIPVLTFNLEETKAIKQGRVVDYSAQNLDSGSIVMIKSDGKLIALGEVCDGFIKPARVFNI